MLRALAVVLVLATVVASCTREREEVVAPDALTAENAFHGSFSNHFVTTVSEFDSVMDVAASGDTITLQASTTFDLSDSTYHKTNFSLNFVGQSPRPTIECNSGSVNRPGFSGDLVT